MAKERVPFVRVNVGEKEELSLVFVRPDRNVIALAMAQSNDVLKSVEVIVSNCLCEKESKICAADLAAREDYAQILLSLAEHTNDIVGKYVTKLEKL